MRTVKTKRPWEETYYTGTWEDELDPGETVVSSDWLVSGTGLTLGSSAPHTPGLSEALVTIWVLGGTAGTTYAITNRITTSLGRKLEGRFYVEVLAA